MYDICERVFRETYAELKEDLEELKALPDKELKVRRQERERHHKMQAKSKLHDKCRVFDELELAGRDEVLREWKARQRSSRMEASLYKYR